MRELTIHKVNGLNELIHVQALDEPGPGNACHRYKVFVPFRNPVESYPQENCRLARAHCDINFQRGPIAECGVNGISNEALLAVVEDRLAGFQSGPFACVENAHALSHLREAISWLHHRTLTRIERGVEGTHEI